MTETNYELLYNNLKIKYDNMTSKFNEYKQMYKKTMDIVDNELNKIQKREIALDKKENKIESYCQEMEIKEDDIKSLDKYSKLELYKRLIMLIEMKDAVHSKIDNVDFELNKIDSNHKTFYEYNSGYNECCEGECPYDRYIDYLERQLKG